MMKKVTLLAVLLLLSVCGASRAQDMGQTWRYYNQEITLEYATPAEAREAMLKALELPVGKTLAVSSRWDDTNYAHLQMCKALTENGWKGTFYLNKCDRAFGDRVVKTLVAQGMSIGAHTTKHPHLETLSPNAMFCQIMGNRVELEAQTDLCVNAFTFPFGLHKPNGDGATEHEQGQALLRTGIYGGGERLGKARTMGMVDEKGFAQFIDPYMFSCNDSDPNPQMFADQFKKGLAVVKAGTQTNGPYIALGVHSWQAKTHKDGFDRLSRIIASEANKPEYWYCNANEYNAWRIAFLNFKLVDTQCEANRVIATVRRIAPMELGCCQPLGVVASPVPTGITVNGASVSVTDEGQAMLPHAEGYTLPEVIDRVDNAGNKAVDPVPSAKIKGVSASFFCDTAANRLKVSITNESAGEMTDVNVTFRLPLRWKSGIVKYPTVVKIVPGDKAVLLEIDAGEIDSNPRYAKDESLLVAQIDFVRGGKTFRLYATTTIAGNVAGK